MADPNVPLEASRHVKTSSSDAAKWRISLLQVGDLSKSGLEALADAASSTALMSHRAACRAALRKVEKWLVEKEQTQTGAVHRYISDKSVVENESRRTDKSSNSPLEFMRHEVQGWQELWTHPDPKYTPESIFPLLQEIRTLAVNSSLPPITREQLSEAINKIGAGKACGVEQLGGQVFRALPEAALDGLLSVLHAVEAMGTWPWQLQVVLVSLLGKPSGGDRAIGLFSEIARLWAEIRSPVANAWVEAMAGKWDQAVRGSSSLRCALVRAFRDECVALSPPEESLCAASACWDIKAFYDTLQLQPILREGLSLNFLSMFLLLETVLHMATCGAKTRRLWPHRSAIEVIGGWCTAGGGLFTMHPLFLDGGYHAEVSPSSGHEHMGRRRGAAVRGLAQAGGGHSLECRRYPLSRR